MLFSGPLKSFALSANDYDIPFCDFDNHDDNDDGDNGDDGDDGDGE